MKNTPPKDGCRNYFATSTATKEAYTKAWIELINEIEERKSVTSFFTKYVPITHKNNGFNSRMDSPTERR